MSALAEKSFSGMIDLSAFLQLLCLLLMIFFTLLMLLCRSPFRRFPHFQNFALLERGSRNVAINFNDTDDDFQQDRLRFQKAAKGNYGFQIQSNYLNTRKRELGDIKREENLAVLSNNSRVELPAMLVKFVKTWTKILSYRKHMTGSISGRELP